MSETRRAGGRQYPRGSDEFSRVIAFSDALFAIAMTLLVVSIAVPTLRTAGDVGQLADALNDLSSKFISFFISFAVIGRYWLAHHQFVSLLRAIDNRIIVLNLVYLGFIAFLPFPTDLLGTYFENPLSVALYAVNVACISGFEVLLFTRAHRARLLEREMPEEIFRWGRLMSTTPVVFFALSIPVAFVSTTAAVAVWFLGVPLGAYMDRRKPAGADDYL
ncbi:MAG: TMEM175 family protein [bacterium]